jgi:hypothetical protein
VRGCPEAENATDQKRNHRSLCLGSEDTDAVILRSPTKE